MADGMTPADMSAVMGGGFNGFGGEGIWIFALLILLFGGNGFGFGGNRESFATQADIQRAVDLNSLQQGQRDIESVVRGTTADTIGAVKDGNFNALGEMRDIQQQVSNNGYLLQQCCCNTEKAILENRYLDEKNASNIMANSTAVGQKILDAISQNKIDELQAKVTELQTAQMFCGVPRISPYGYGITPQFANACGCGVTI